MEKRYLLIFIMIVLIFILFNSNYQSQAVREKGIYDSSQGTKSSIQYITNPLTEPAPIGLNCDTPQVIDPITNINVQQGAEFSDNQRYLAWYEFIVGATSNIALKDLGPDKTFGTPDDGPKIILPSNTNVNYRPDFDGNTIYWASNSVPNINIFNRIMSCSILCITPTQILSINFLSFPYAAEIKDLSVDNNLVVYTINVYNTLNGVSVSDDVYLYNINTQSNTLTYSSPSSVFSSIYDVEINGDYIAFSTVNNVFIYRISTDILTQVTNSPSGTVTGFPRLADLGSGVYLLMFNQGGTTVQVNALLINNGILQPAPYGSPNLNLGDINYDSVQNILRIAYLSTVGIPGIYNSIGLRLVELTSGNSYTTVLQNPFTTITDNVMAIGDQNIAFSTFLAPLNTRIAISKCEIT